MKKQKKVKRLIALALCCMMLVSCFGMSASAYYCTQTTSGTVTFGYHNQNGTPKITYYFNKGSLTGPDSGRTIGQTSGNIGGNKFYAYTSIQTEKNSYLNKSGSSSLTYSDTGTLTSKLWEKTTHCIHYNKWPTSGTYQNRVGGTLVG